MCVAQFSFEQFWRQSYMSIYGGYSRELFPSWEVDDQDQIFTYLLLFITITIYYFVYIALYRSPILIFVGNKLISPVEFPQK